MFYVYEKIKLTDQPDNVDTMCNSVRPYNEIEVIPNPVKLQSPKK